MDYNIITPQFVKIRQDPASIGERIIARLIDYFIMFVWMAFWTYIDNTFLQLGHPYSDWYIMFLVFLPVLFYTFLWETFNNGQTPGKRVMKIRVVRKDGRRPTIGNYFMRWILEIVDIGISGLGLIVILLTHDSQRLGDLAAGTMVIKVNRPLNIGISLDDFSYARRNYRPTYPNVDDLSSGQIAAISNALDKYNDSYYDSNLKALADKVARKLGVTYNDSPGHFLNKVLHDYQYYATELI